MSSSTGPTYNGPKHLTPDDQYHADSKDGGRGPVDDYGNSKFNAVGERNLNHQSYYESMAQQFSSAGMTSGGPGGGLGVVGLGGGPIGWFVVLLLALIVGWWLYPITGLASVFLWHILTYLISQFSAITFAHLSWCQNDAFFSLLSALSSSKACVGATTHGVFGYNIYAAMVAGLIASIMFFFLVRPIERHLVRSGAYLAFRHVWRCAVPMVIFVPMFGYNHSLTVFGRVGLSAATVLVIHWIVTWGSRSFALTSSGKSRFPYHVVGAIVVLVTSAYFFWFGFWSKDALHRQDAAQGHFREGIASGHRSEP